MDILIGLKDQYQLLYKHRNKSDSVIKVNKTWGLKMDLTDFRFVVNGGKSDFKESVTCINNAEVDLVRISKYIPLDYLLERIFSDESEYYRAEREGQDTKLTEMAKEVFRKNVQVNFEKDNRYRFEVFLNMLPPEYYPSLDGSTYLPVVLARQKKLEARLSISINESWSQNFMKEYQV